MLYEGFIPAVECLQNAKSWWSSRSRIRDTVSLSNYSKLLLTLCRISCVLHVSIWRCCLLVLGTCENIDTFACCRSSLNSKLLSHMNFEIYSTVKLRNFNTLLLGRPNVKFLEWLLLQKRTTWWLDGTIWSPFTAMPDDLALSISSCR